MTDNRVDGRRLLAYALPGFVLAMPTIPAAIYLPTMYGAELGLAAAGTALLIARSFDVITDPLVGMLSDRWRLPWGRRKPWILAGALLGGIALIQLFQPPAGVSFAALTLWSVLLYLGWTMINVPYSAWGAEMSADYHERTRITSAREGVMLMGIFCASAIPAVAAGFGTSEREALAIISWLAIALGGPFVGWMLIRVPDPLPAPDAAKPPSWRRFSSEARIILKNRPFTRLVTAWFINGLANGIPSTLFLLFLERRLMADQAERGGLILLYFVCAVLAIPGWLAASRRFGKHRTWCWAMALTCAAFVWVPLIPAGAIGAFAIVCAITGAGLGADLALPPALQADVIDIDQLESGENRAGLFFALWGMATKLALAAAVGIAFPLLAFFGFEARAGGGEQGLFALAMIYSLFPVVLKLLAIAALWNFPLSEDQQRAVRKTIESLDTRPPAAHA